MLIVWKGGRLSGWDTISSVWCGFNMKIRYFWIISVPPLNVHVLLRSVTSGEWINIWLSFTQNYALNVIVWVHVHPPPPFFFFFVIIAKKYELQREKGARKYITTNCAFISLCLFCGRRFWARRLRQRGIHGALFAPRTFRLVFITFPLTIHLDS